MSEIAKLGGWLQGIMILLFVNIFISTVLATVVIAPLFKH